MVKIIPYPLTYRQTYRTGVESDYTSGTVNASGSTDIIDISSAKGVLHGFQIEVEDVDLVDMEIKIIVDGTTIADLLGTGIVALFSTVVADISPPIYGYPWRILNLDTTNKRYSFAFQGPVKFNSSLKITLINNNTSTSLSYRFQPVIEKSV